MNCLIKFVHAFPKAKRRAKHEPEKCGTGALAWAKHPSEVAVPGKAGGKYRHAAIASAKMDFSDTQVTF